MKLDLLNNATVVEDAIRFVSQKSKENLKSTSGKGDKEDSNEPGYDEDMYQLEERKEELIEQINEILGFHK
jgi:hypothetical protein